MPVKNPELVLEHLTSPRRSSKINPALGNIAHVFRSYQKLTEWKKLKFQKYVFIITFFYLIMIILPDKYLFTEWKDIYQVELFK